MKILVVSIIDEDGSGHYTGNGFEDCDLAEDAVIALENESASRNSRHTVKLTGRNDYEVVFGESVLFAGNSDLIFIFERHDDLYSIMPVYGIWFVFDIIVKHNVFFCVILNCLIVACKMLDHIIPPLLNDDPQQL